MAIPQLVASVEEVFAELETEIASFQSHSKLFCLTGCGECCKKPDIEATILEFLPFADYLYQNNIAEKYLDKIQSGEVGDLCLIFSPHYKSGMSGLCGEYKYRGLICRLFGYSASLDKHGIPVLATCKIIKESQTENYNNISEKLKNGESIPVMRNYYMKLYAIDPMLSEKFYPINEAIAKAIEKVLFYQQYKETED